MQPSPPTFMMFLSFIPHFSQPHYTGGVGWVIGCSRSTELAPASAWCGVRMGLCAYHNAGVQPLLHGIVHAVSKEAALDESR